MQQEAETLKEIKIPTWRAITYRERAITVAGLDSQLITLGKYRKPGFKKSMYGKNEKFLTLNQLKL